MLIKHLLLFSICMFVNYYAILYTRHPTATIGIDHT